MIRQCNKSILIVGPTCSGKTALSLNLAKQINAEIISADSMQVYKQFNIVTAKPSLADMQNVPHHLVDSIDVWDDFDVASFAQQVKQILPTIYSQNKYPIVVGGTGMYVMSLTEGIFEGVPVCDSVRVQLARELEEKGNAFLYSKLQKYDKLASEKIHLNDTKRIMRALEVTLSCGKPFSEVRQNKTPVLDDFLIYGISLPRSVLYQRIEDRVDKMMEEGAVFEIEKILKNDKKISRTAAQALGFKEIAGYINGEYDKERAVYLLKKNTRNFAKRQLTWFRRDKKIQWLDINDINKACLKIKKDLDISG